MTAEVSFRVTEEVTTEAPPYFDASPGTLAERTVSDDDFESFEDGPGVRVRLAAGVAWLLGRARVGVVWWLLVVAASGGRVRWAVAWCRMSLGRGGRAAMAGLRVVAQVFAAFVMSLGGAAQVAGVVVGTWAAWEVDATAGRLVLAVGLLFLGGAIGRVVREVRNGSTR